MADPVAVSEARLGEIARLGVPVPGYDRRALRPHIVHVGVGGFHRAHLAVYAHELAGMGGRWGIAGLGLLEQDARIAAALEAQDDLYTLIVRGAASPLVEVIGSIVRFVHAPPGRDDAVARLLAAPATAIVSLTVTEGGYAQDANPTFDRLVAALDERRRSGGGPVTILSCDNLPGNGEAARAATLAAAARAGSTRWIEDHCTFPSSMVDRITPVTQDADRRWLRDEVGIDDRWPVVAEPFRQWVMEDAFAAGRPRWEDAGAVFTTRIHDWELYKLRLLNAGHSAIAYLAALAGVTLVHEAMAVPELRSFLEGLLLHEAMPTLTEIPGHPREEYIASVLERFANPGVRDQIERLCADGSAKLPKFLVPTIEQALERGGPVERTALATAAWARYLGTVPPARRAADPPADRSSARFRAAFAAAYESIAARGPLAAAAATP